MKVNWEVVELYDYPGLRNASEEPVGWGVRRADGTGPNHYVLWGNGTVMVLDKKNAEAYCERLNGENV